MLNLHIIVCWIRTFTKTKLYLHKKLTRLNTQSRQIPTLSRSLLCKHEDTKKQLLRKLKHTHKNNGKCCLQESHLNTGTQPVLLRWPQQIGEQHQIAYGNGERLWGELTTVWPGRERQGQKQSWWAFDCFNQFQNVQMKQKWSLLGQMLFNTFFSHFSLHTVACCILVVSMYNYTSPATFLSVWKITQHAEQQERQTVLTKQDSIRHPASCPFPGINTATLKWLSVHNRNHVFFTKGVEKNLGGLPGSWYHLF